uniref:SRR1-like protein isoform X2 n=1 Tax=Geotrypetes seraphini TaxID=260995 RepID=A0A6P8RXI1_GEOSA|nr:SRR1-like protein isoform X2 [Geotrypetes seraphini]
MEGCPWQTVSSKKGTKKRINKIRTEIGGEGTTSWESGCQDNEVDCGKIKLKIQQAKEELTTSTFWYFCQRLIEDCFSKFVEQIKEKPSFRVEDIRPGEEPSSTPLHQQDTQLVPEPGEGALGSRHEFNCVCYGVGRFSSCITSRYQLALLLLLLEKLQVPKHRCRVFDPLFSRWEIAILQALGLTVVFENEEGKHKILTPTIFYMIHCGKALYNNLLWRNWSVDSLSKVIIIGNSFKRIEERF